MNLKEGRDLLTVRDVAFRLSMSVRNVWRKAETGEIPKPVKIGGKTIRWRVSDLQAWLASLPPHEG